MTKRAIRSTIRGKLISRTLLVVMIPLLIVGAVAIVALTRLSHMADEDIAEARSVLGDDVVGSRAAGIADQISREIATFLDERLDDVVGWARDGGVVTAAASAGRQAEITGLTELTTEELEALFADDHQMRWTLSAALRSDLAVSSDFKEVFFTNEYGFNVASSHQTTDFVQSDEAWWQQAWAQGMSIGVPAFDHSARVFAVDIAIRIDGSDGTPVGVMKASLDIALVQRIADRFAAGDGGYEVTILERLGRFVASTEIDHDPTAIMNSIVTALTSGDERLIAGLEGEAASLPVHFSIDDEAITGYGHVYHHLVEMRDTDLVGFDEALDWTVVVEQPSDVGFAALATLESLSSDMSDSSNIMKVVLLAVGAIATALAVGSSLVFSRRITGPIQKLRNAAVHAAEEALPALVALIDAVGVDEEIPALEAVVIETGDEVEDLAHSFNTVQQVAAALAAQQARLRRQNVAGTFVSMGRRYQNLLTKQLEHIRAIEQAEIDPDSLGRLRDLDHLATRMRRNAESLLVLAGEETPRRFGSSVSIRRLVQAAAGEIEEYGRIRVGTLDEAEIDGEAASDLAHLTAELLENAARFSPPASSIVVYGRRRPDGGYSLTIIDQGPGMEKRDLVAANARLTNPVEFDRAPSAYLGLFVVGHLARRHGVVVRLTDAPDGGVSAVVHLPVGRLVGGLAPDGRSTGVVSVASPEMPHSPAVPASGSRARVLLPEADRLESTDDHPRWGR